MHLSSFNLELRVKASDAEESAKNNATDEVTPDNLFEGIDARLLEGIQDFAEKEGLDSEEGVQRLVSNQVDPSSADFIDLLGHIVDATGMDSDTAREQLLKW